MLQGICNWSGIQYHWSSVSYPQHSKCVTANAAHLEREEWLCVGGLCPDQTCDTQHTKKHHASDISAESLQGRITQGTSSSKSQQSTSHT